MHTYHTFISLTTCAVVDLGIYPQSMFNFFLAIGLLFTRRHRKRLNIPRTEWHAWTVVVYFAILANLYLLVAPWYPPSTGATGGDVSFWYGTYVVVGISLYVLSCFFFRVSIGLTLFTSIGFCGVYYFVYMKILPHFGGYQFRQTIIAGPSGETSHKMVKVPNDELAKWDEEHDAAGRLRRRANANKSDQPEDA